MAELELNLNSIEFTVLIEIPPNSLAHKQCQFTQFGRVVIQVPGTEDHVGFPPPHDMGTFSIIQGSAQMRTIEKPPNSQAQRTICSIPTAILKCTTLSKCRVRIVQIEDPTCFTQAALVRCSSHSLIWYILHGAHWYAIVSYPPNKFLKSWDSMRALSLRSCVDSLFGYAPGYGWVGSG